MKFSSALVAIYLGLATATPVYRSVSNSKRVVRRSSHLHKRQVPQEHSHDIVLTITKEMLDLDNPKEIADPVFGLLGDAAAADGAGKVTNLACLKQETADQAYTNAKAIGDLRGMAGSLLFQAIERNTAGVGVASKLCTDKAVNPEIAALTQHQDAASEGAGAINKAITLELAKQLAGIGADPNLALLSGTFAPGDVSKSTSQTCLSLLTLCRLVTQLAKETLVMIWSLTWVASSLRSYLCWMPQRMKSPQQSQTWHRHSLVQVASSQLS